MKEVVVGEDTSQVVRIELNSGNPGGALSGKPRQGAAVR